MNEQDFIVTQYFTSKIPNPNPICGMVSLPDEVDDARDNLKDKPAVIYSMAAYQMKIMSMAERSGVPPIDHVLFWRRHEARLRDKWGDSIPLINRVDRALCIYALDSLLRTLRGDDIPIPTYNESHEITVPVCIKHTVEPRRERIRVDIHPGNKSLIIEKDGSIHE